MDCKCCGQRFSIDDKDRELLDRLAPQFATSSGPVRCRIPDPTFCPDCRQQRRLLWRNERNLYADSCDRCKKSIISLYSPDKRYTVFCQDCWWGHDWDPLEYGRDWVDSRPFFDQFRELQLAVPRAAIYNLHSENSQYANHSSNNKNCYMGVDIGNCEDCSYGHWVMHSKNTFDGLYLDTCEHCYNCSYCNKCFQTFHSSRCEGCSDSAFCFECRACDNCLGCVQLQRKRNYILNQPATAEAVNKKREELFSSRKKLAEFRQEVRDLVLRTPRRYTYQLNCEGCVGDDLYNCRNAEFSFNCRNLEDCRYMFDLGNNRTSMDCYEHGWLVQSELNYQCHAGMAGYHMLFCNICSECRDLILCDLCMKGCANLFGCISLKKQEYCILNKQYTREQYELLVPRIIRAMEARGEWGDFFPAALSTFGYNESPAQEYFPYERAAALQAGFVWCDYEAPRPSVTRVLKAADLPERIADVPDDIVQAGIECEVTGRLFRITSQELKFYRTHGIPLPTRHFDQRHRERIREQNRRRIVERSCGRCSEKLLTTFQPEQTELVYCERCYRDTVFM